MFYTHELFSILQSRNLTCKLLICSYTRNRWQNQELNPDLSSLSPMLTTNPPFLLIKMPSILAKEVFCFLAPGVQSIG